MSLKRILVLASGSPEDRTALDFAAWIAGQHRAHADVLPVYPDAAADTVAMGLTLGAVLLPEAVAELAAAERGLQSQIEQAAREAAHSVDVVYGEGEGVPRLCMLSRGLRPDLALSRQTPLCDLVILSQEEVQAGGAYNLVSHALLGDQVPILIARGDPDRLSGDAAIAWDGSAQAGRAVRAALPLLAMASAIHILQCERTLDRTVADPDVDRLNAYLKLHGVGSGTLTLVEGPRDGEAMAAMAEAQQVGLLVAGAWGHSRLQETLFGGATRSLLHRVSGPSLLMAH